MAHTGKSYNRKHLKKFFLKVSEGDFFVRVTEHMHRLPRELVESSPLEILKSHLYIHDPGQPPLDSPT